MHAAAPAASETSCARITIGKSYCEENPYDEQTRHTPEGPRDREDEKLDALIKKMRDELRAAYTTAHEKGDRLAR